MAGLRSRVVHLQEVDMKTSLTAGLCCLALAMLSPSLSVIADEREQLPKRLEEVIVTGEKIQRSLMETTTSISVFDAESLASQGDRDLADMLRRAGNTTSNEEGNISIRGISQAGAGGGTGSPLISVQVDGVTLDETSQDGAVVDMFDVASVEVLRGAQSSSQGRNSLAGAVVINTREPTREWDGHLRLIATEHDAGSAAFAGGGPLSDSFAFRLTGIADRDDGFVTHQPDNNPDFARTERQVLRLKLAYEPAYIDGFDSLLTLSRDRRDGQPDYNIERGVSGTDPDKRRTSWVNEESRDLVESDVVSWRNRYAFNDKVTLTSVTSYMTTHQDYLRDYDGLEDDGGENIIFNDGENLTQELRLNFTGVGRYTGVLGVYAGRFKKDNTTYSNNITVPSSYLLGIPEEIDFLYAEIDFLSEEHSDARNVALFTEVDIQLPWRLTATLGLRYDREKLDANSRFDSLRGEAFFNVPSGLSSFPLGGEQIAEWWTDVLSNQSGIDILPLLIATGAAPATSGLQGGETTYSALLPKAALRFDASDEWSFFLSYSQAYRAGGVSVDSSNGEVFPFDPEYTDNYEMGFRAEFPEQRLQLAANVFYVEWEDQQVPVLRGLFYATENAANSELYGTELSLGWQPWTPLTLTGSLGWVETEFLNYTAQGEDYSGNEFIFAPRFTGSLGAVLRVGAWMASANVSHREHSFTRPSNRETEFSEARTLLDMRLGWEGEHLSAYLFGRNLTDEDYITETYQFPDGYIGATEARGYATYGRPRELGLQLELRY